MWPEIVGALAVALLGYLFIRFRSILARARIAIVHYLRLHGRLATIGLAQFYESRDAYRRRDTGVPLIQYLNLTQHTLEIVSIWLGFGIRFENLIEKLTELIKNRRVEVTISLINPRSAAVDAVAPALDTAPEELRVNICSSLRRLHELRQEFGREENSRYILKVHNVLPLGSAIIIDGDTPQGRFQLETKPYKVDFGRSFGFELRGPGKYFYDVCVSSWRHIIRDAEIFDPNRHLV